MPTNPNLKQNRDLNNLHSLFMQAPALIAILKGREGICELFSPMFTRMWGGRKVLGKTMRKAWPELEGQGWYEIVERVYDSGASERGYERPAVADWDNNGQPYEKFFNYTYSPYYNADGDLYGVMIFGADVTEQVLAKKHLEESEAKLRFLAESMPQKVFIADGEGSITYFNDEWFDYTGLDFKQIKGWGWTQFIHKDDLDENVRLWKNALETGEQFEMEHRFRRKDGVYHWHLSRARAMKDKNGDIIGWYGSNTDIDQIKQARKQRDELEAINTALKRQRTELVALNQTKEEFISVASHQLRTPATAVKQFLAMLEQGYAEELLPQQAELIRKAYMSNERQLMIIDDLLRVAKADAGKVPLRYEDVDINGLVRKTAADFEEVFKKRSQKCSLSIKNEPLFINIDRAQIQMVIENLLDNASKYSPQSTEIIVKVQKTKTRARISISDQGVGIAEKDFDKLFQKFSRVPNSRSVEVGGSGLGLYWVKKIIDLHHGSIDLESEKGKGSTFTLNLPIK